MKYIRKKLIKGIEYYYFEFAFRTISKEKVVYTRYIGKSLPRTPELKRRLKGESVNIEHLLSGRPYDFKTITDILAIPDEDILSLRPWLEENKEKTQEAVERLFCSRNIDEYELPLASDIPSVRRQAEEFAGVHIQKYHKTLGKFLQGLTEVGVFLRDINAVPTTQERSYFDCLRNNLAFTINSSMLYRL